jgi:hypothetical protein
MPSSSSLRAFLVIAQVHARLPGHLLRRRLKEFQRLRRELSTHMRRIIACV